MPDNTPQKASPSYRLATEDPDLLLRDEMRPQRFALEFAKADYALRDWGVRSTVVVFGSARIPSPEHVAEARRIKPSLVEVNLSGAGHNVRREAFAGSLAAIRSFLASS